LFIDNGNTTLVISFLFHLSQKSLLKIYLAFLLAPLFVWIEVLFIFGYRPALRKRLETTVRAAIESWKKESTHKHSKKAA